MQIFKIAIKVTDDTPAVKVHELCNEEACTAKWVHNDTWEISSDDPINFFSLGAAWAEKFGDNIISKK